ncbi:regulatory protein RecX [Mycolicibacterium litorale]|uniref:Regulatory protein RecX n=1 Tax=Mycolicibacterium litorale TaxID=758802 RepID=A0A6S6NZB8_9MYCO|nr:recombination regulator RecX [Mycolicibacterium litorale]BCI52813.1 regulatory protein RecX [Mycolicibacterium litorale]
MTSFPHPSTSESDPDEDRDRDDPTRDDPTRDEQAHAYCLRLLVARARTRAELAGKLAQRGYPEPVTQRILDRLTTVGLVDDEDFAEQWVRSRHLYAGKGKRALAAELRRKGVDAEVIATTLSDIDAGAERDRAEQLVRDRLRRERLDDDPGSDLKVKRRLAGMLARRGYSQSMALDVVTVELASERERRRV